MNGPLVGRNGAGACRASRREAAANARPSASRRMIDDRLGPSADRRRNRSWRWSSSSGDMASHADAGALDAWEALAQTLLLSNEFAYVD